MPVRHAFEYAVIRIVPRVERGEFVNAGVVLFCRTLRFLEARVAVDADRLRALGADIDLEAVAALLHHWTLICRGGDDIGELGALPAAERFRWVAAPRSTVVQSSEVHCGLCLDPAAQLEQLFAALVAPPGVMSSEPPVDRPRFPTGGLLTPRPL